MRLFCTALLFLVALAWTSNAQEDRAATGFEQFRKDLERIDLLLNADAEAAKRELDALGDGKRNIDVRDMDYIKILNAKYFLLTGRTNDALSTLNDINTSNLTINFLIRYYNLYSTAYYIMGKYDQMFEIFTKGINLIDEVNDVNLSIGFRHTVITTLIDIGAIDEALGLGRDLLDYALAHDNIRGACYASFHIGTAYRILEDLDTAEQTLAFAREKCAAVADLAGESGAIYGLARIALARGRAEQVLEILDEALAKTRESGFGLLESDISAVRAEALLLLGRHDEAAEVARAAISIASATHYQQALRDLTLSLARAEEALGRTAEALAAYRQHIAVNEIVQNDKLARRLAYHRTRYDSLEKKRQIQILEQQKELLELSRALERKSRQNLQLLVAFGVALLLLLALWLMRSIRQRRAFKLQAECDGLTGLANRSHFIARARATLAASDEAPFSIIIFDLDHFKTLNDRFGHAAGDWVLREVAEKCRDKIRQSDIFGRIGGEEFAICMPGAGLEEAVRVAESCREALRNIDGSDFAEDLVVTASFGIATRRAGERNLDPILIRADTALYEAKRAGRDMVRIDMDARPGRQDGKADPGADD